MNETLEKALGYLTFGRYKPKQKKHKVQYDPEQLEAIARSRRPELEKRSRATHRYHRAIRNQNAHYATTKGFTIKA